MDYLTKFYFISVYSHVTSHPPTHKGLRNVAEAFVCRGYAALWMSLLPKD